jgi:hypothetical protein
MNLVLVESGIRYLNSLAHQPAAFSPAPLRHKHQELPFVINIRPVNLPKSSPFRSSSCLQKSSIAQSVASAFPTNRCAHSATNPKRRGRRRRRKQRPSKNRDSARLELSGVDDEMSDISHSHKCRV